MRYKYFFIIMIFLNFVNHLFSNNRSQANKLAKELVRNAKKGDFKLFEEFANKKANLNYQDSDGKNILMYAVKFKRNDIVKALSKYNINPNLLDEDNLSALMHASSGGNIDIIKNLLEFKNLNINKQGRYGETALDYAYSPNKFYKEQVEYLSKLNKTQIPKERKEIIDLLKNHGAKTANELDKPQINVINK